MVFECKSDLIPGNDFYRNGSENSRVHRIGMVACFISEIVQARYFGGKIIYKTWILPNNNLFMKNNQSFKPVRRLSKMLPICFGKGKCCSRLRCPVKFPTPPTHASRSGSHATMIAFCRGNCYFSSETLKLYLTSSWIGKPIADRYCSFEAGPPRKCIYDGEKSHSGFPYCHRVSMRIHITVSIFFSDTMQRPHSYSI